MTLGALQVLYAFMPLGVYKHQVYNGSCFNIVVICTCQVNGCYNASAAFNASLAPVTLQLLFSRLRPADFVANLSIWRLFPCLPVQVCCGSKALHIEIYLLVKGIGKGI